MEKQPHQEYRDEKAKELKEKRKTESGRKDAQTQIDELRKTSSEYKFSKNIHNLEREKRDISDQLIGFLDEHNLSEINEEQYTEFLQYLKPRNKGVNLGLTYSKEVSPILIHFSPMEQQRFEAIQHHLEMNKKYWEAKEHWSELSSKEREELIEFSPYGHGAMVGRIGNVFNSQLFEKGVPAYVTEFGGYINYKRIFAKILAKIDRGELENIKIQNDFKKIYDLYLDSISRLITLAIRDSSWRFDDLNNYLITKLGKDKFDMFDSFSKQSGEYDTASDKSRKFDIADLGYFENLSSSILEFWIEINQYLKEKVTY